MDKSYPLHEGARSALRITGVLCCLLVIGIPLGIWLFVRAGKARVALTDEGLSATNAFASTAFAWRDVARLGLLKIAIVTGGGMGGALARQRVGGDEATHVVVRLADGKLRSFMVSAYENMAEIVDVVERRTGKPCEALTPGALGVGSAKWP